MKLTRKSLLKNVSIGYTVHSYIWYGKFEDIKDTIRKRKIGRGRRKIQYFK